MGGFSGFRKFVQCPNRMNQTGIKHCASINETKTPCNHQNASEAKTKQDNTDCLNSIIATKDKLDLASGFLNCQNVTVEKTA